MIKNDDAKPKITMVHCEHILIHLRTGNGREATLVRPGRELLLMTSYIWTLDYIQPTEKHKIILCRERSRKQL